MATQQQILGAVREVAEGFAADREARQPRRHLERADFDALADAGFLRAIVPREHGGASEGIASGIRSLAEIQRALGRGDSSVALVSSMHPSVLAFWAAAPPPPAEAAQAWEAQIARIYQSALDGSWWGTVTSEPGSGGDIWVSKATARRDGDAYHISGVKHFGSGSGIASYMVTTARPDDAEPDLFVFDMRDRPWDGSAGMTLLGEWDGHGMVATQSHSFRFDDCPAERIAWQGNLRNIAVTAGPAINVLFSAVIVGIMDAAMEVARRQLTPMHGSLRAYQQVAWSDIEQEAWLIERAYEGIVAAVESRAPSAAREVLVGRMAIARLAESALERMGTVIGGGTYQRRSPIGWWHQDVRALLFLRPPLPLAYDQLHALSWPAEG